MANSVGEFDAAFPKIPARCACGRDLVSLRVRIRSVNRPDEHEYFARELCARCLEEHEISAHPGHDQFDEGAEITALCAECQSEVSSYRIEVENLDGTLGFVDETLCEFCADEYTLSRLIISRIGQTRSPTRVSE